MSWRSRLSTPSSGEHGDKPSLEAVLTHYGLDLAHKTRQMTHCLLHEDNTSSLSVDTDKQLWNCHSCGNGGDSWGLIMRMEDCDFNGARGWAKTTLGFAAGDAGGGSPGVRAGARGRPERGGVRARSGPQSRDSSYRPAWRRRDT